MGIQRFLFVAVILCAFVLKSCSSPQPEQRNFIIARDLTWYPLDLMGKESNMLGFIDDLLLAIAKEGDLSIDLAFTTSNTMLSGINSGLFDGGVSSLQPNSNTRQEYQFSEPLVRLGAVLIVNKDSNINTLSDLQEKELGIHRGSAIAFDTVRFPSVTVIPYENNMLALEDLADKSIDGAVMQVIPASIYIQSFFNKNLKIVTQPLTDLALRVVMQNNKTNENFLKAFDEGLKVVKQSGLYDELFKKWGLFNPESVDSKIKLTPQEVTEFPKSK